MLSKFQSLLAQAVIAASLFAVPAQADLAQDGELVIGVIGNNVSKKTKRYSPLANYLQQHLSDVGVRSVRTHIVTTSEEMAKVMKEGKAHLFFDSPLVSAKIAKRSKAKPVLRRWKKGMADYGSVIVVPAKSKIRRVKDLRGKRIAFQDRDSTSGFMLPANDILSAGLTMVEKNRPQDPYDMDKVNYYFTGSDRHTATWLAKGWVEAAGTDTPTFEKLKKARPGAFRVIARSIRVPRNVVLVSSHVSSDINEAIVSVLMDMDKSEQGQEILKNFKKTKKMDAFPNGVEATFTPIYAMIDRLAGQDLF